jgi:hypothetical protein
MATSGSEMTCHESTEAKASQLTFKNIGLTDIEMQLGGVNASR